MHVGHQLVQPLGRGVGPAALGRRAVDPVVVLLEPVGVVLAVDLAGGRDHVGHPVADRGLHHVLGAVQVDPQRPQRRVDDVVDAHRRCQVEHRVGLRDQVVDQVPVQDVPLYEAEPG